MLTLYTKWSNTIVIYRIRLNKGTFFVFVGRLFLLHVHVLASIPYSSDGVTGGVFVARAGAPRALGEGHALNDACVRCGVCVLQYRNHRNAADRECIVLRHQRGLQCFRTKSLEGNLGIIVDFEFCTYILGQSD